MNTSTIHEIKQELQQRPTKELVELCLRLAKFKKENKELLNFLLFESGNEQAYIDAIKLDTEKNFSEVPSGHNSYLKVKMLRKILRTINRYIRYTGSTVVEVQLLLHFCKTLKESGIRIASSTALQNMYDKQIEKVEKGIAKLHEDLQFDYQNELDELILSA